MDSSYGEKRIKITDSGGIEIPKQVIKTVSTARSIFYTLRAEHLKRIYLYAEIDGMIAGNPPYDTTELASAGLSAIANFNTLEPRALYEKAGQSYWNLLFTSESVIDIRLKVKDPSAAALGEILSRTWNDTVRDPDTGWKSFDINTSTLCGQLVKFGLSPIFWPDDNSPFWRVIETNKFFIADQSASDLDLLSNLCLESEYPLVYMLEIYTKFKDDRANSPWNIDVLEKFLMWRANGPYKDNPLPTDLVEWQRKLYQGDIMFEKLYNDTVRMVSLYFMEGNGSITHYMFHRDWSDGDKLEDGFLYVKQNAAKDFGELLLIFTQSPGEMYLHGNRGLGHKMFSLCQAKMMMDNSLVDLARWSSTPIVKSPSMTVKDAEAIRFIPGVMTNIGPMEFQQNNLGANLQGVVNTSQYFSSLLQQNAAFSGDDSGRPDASMGSLSPDVFRMAAYKEFNVLRNQISHFYKTFDSLLSQMTVRMCNSTAKDKGYELYKDWKARSIEEGVPAELFKSEKGRLPKYFKVKATRTAGAGSQVGYLIGLKEVEPLVGTFGKRAQIAYIRDKIKAAMGPEFVEAYTQDMDDPDELGGGASLAQLENGAMQDGKSALAEPSNDHQTHISVHLALGKQTQEQLLQQQLDAVQVDRIYGQLIPHIQEHVKYLSGSIFAKSFLEGVKKDIYDLTKLAQINRRNAERQLQAEAEKQQRDAEATQGVMSDEQRKDFVAQRGEQRKDFQVGKQVQRADKANELRGEVVREKTDADIEALRRKTDAEVTSKNPPLEETDPSKELAKIVGASKTLTPFDFA